MRWNNGFVLALMIILNQASIVAQNCSDLYIRANEYRKNKEYDKAILYYQKAKECDSSLAPDCDDWISRIKNVRQDLFKVSQSKLEYTSIGGEQTLNVTSNKNWNFQIDAQWINCKRSGNTIYVSCAKNESVDSRDGAIIVSSGSQRVIVRVEQEGDAPKLITAASSLGFTSDGGEEYVEISTNDVWQTQTNALWCTAERLDSAIRITTEANHTVYSRECIVFIQSTLGLSANIKISQGAGGEELTFSKNNLSFDKDGGDMSIRVYSDIDDWYCTSYPHWCNVNRKGDSLYIHCVSNEANDMEREGNINVSTGRRTESLYIRQELRPSYEPITKVVGGRNVSFGLSAGYIVPIITSQSSSSDIYSLVNYGIGGNNESASYSTFGGWAVGALSDIRLYKNLYIMAKLNLSQYSYLNSIDAEAEYKRQQTKEYYLKGMATNVYTEKYKTMYMGLDILASYKFPINKVSHLSVAVGPTFRYALWGKMYLSGQTDSETLRAYKISAQHEYTDARYDGYSYRIHSMLDGSLNLFTGDAVLKETLFVDNISDTLLENTKLSASPFNRAHWGWTFDLSFEYRNSSISVFYYHSFTNIANWKFWKGDRWSPVSENSTSWMPDYEQRNHFIGLSINYIFRNKI